MYSEDSAWPTIDLGDLWYMDKLILSKKLDYKCGPVGIGVPESGEYIVRPAVNPLGLGLGAKKVFIEKDTDHLDPGYFWCEWFTGRHFSVDYHWGKPVLCVEGFRSDDDLTRWDEWKKVVDWPALDHALQLPKILQPVKDKYEWINCEFVGSKLIEVHFRRNPDFQWGNDIFIPVFGTDTRVFDKPEEWGWISCPDMNGRTGAWVYPLS